MEIIKSIQAQDPVMVQLAASERENVSLRLTVVTQRKYGTSWDDQLSNHPKYTMSLLQEISYQL